jgi:hypothetical protein
VDQVPTSTSLGPTITSSDITPVSKRITELLMLALKAPNKFASKASWSEELLRTAIRKWEEGTIALTLSNRQLFVEMGFDDSWSFSEYKSGVLYVTTGFLDAAELGLYQDRLHHSFAYL